MGMPPTPPNSPPTELESKADTVSDEDVEQFQLFKRDNNIEMNTILIYAEMENISLPQKKTEKNIIKAVLGSPEYKPDDALTRLTDLQRTRSFLDNTFKNETEIKKFRTFLSKKRNMTILFTDAKKKQTMINKLVKSGVRIEDVEEFLRSRK